VTDIVLRAQQLTADAFSPFGEVIETGARLPELINAGTCECFADLARIDVLEAGGRPRVSLFRAQPRSLPLPVRGLERHPLSSQAFVPLERHPFLVVVADAGDTVTTANVRAFLASGLQGVNYRRNTWHHALIALEGISHFLVVDRAGADPNCEETLVAGGRFTITLAPAPPAGADQSISTAGASEPRATPGLKTWR